MPDRPSYELELSMLARIKGISFVEIARQMRPPVSPAAISAWATGIRGLTDENAAQIAAILQEDVSVIRRCIEVSKARRKQRKASKPSPDPGTSRHRRHGSAQARASIAV